MGRKLQIAGLVVLAIVAASLSLAALPEVRSQWEASSGGGPVASSKVAPIGIPTVSPTATASAAIGASAAIPTATPTTAGIAGLAERLAADEPVSILVLGDGSGDATDEWVFLWADGGH